MNDGDLISRKALLEKECCGRISGNDVRNAPAVDAVEVVRCKDCVNYKPYAKPVEDFDGFCEIREDETDDYEFCSYGKRRNE